MLAQCFVLFIGVSLLLSVVFVSVVQRHESAVPVHISPLCCRRALSRAPCAVQHVLISYLFYT